MQGEVCCLFPLVVQQTQGAVIECGGLQCEHNTGIFVVFNRLSHRTHCLDLGIARGCLTSDCVNDNTQEDTQWSSVCTPAAATSFPPSLRWAAPAAPAHMSERCSGPRWEPTSHSQQPDDCLQRGFSLTPHFLSLQRGQLHVSEMTDVEEVQQQREKDHTPSERKLLSNMITTHGPRGLRINRAHEGKALFYSS